MKQSNGNKNFIGLKNSECVVSSKYLLENADDFHNDAKIL